MVWSHKMGVRRAAFTVVLATAMLATVGMTRLPTAGASTSRSLQAIPANGVWPGVGKVCEPGSGGPSSVRGVSSNAIHLAVFNDASSTIEPGLEKEFVQWANAFADWCNASGGINGRHIVIDSRDAALFNAAQVTNQACQSDFMAVGGGMALDAPSVPVRVGCGLGQISGYTVSDASQTAADQVNPNNINPRYVPAGYFAALAKKYPQAVKKSAMGSENNPSILEPMHKQEDAAQALGWRVADFQLPPLSVNDWAPYIEDLQTKGITAVWPSTDAIIAPYLQAMSTAGYKPAFILLGTQFYNSTLTHAMAGLQLPPVYVETSWWPLESASQNASTNQLVQVMHKYAPGDAINFDDEEGAEAWLLWAKAASACGANLTSSCVLTNAATQKNWSAGGIQAPVAQLVPSNQNPVPSPCFALLKASSSGFSYDKTTTHPTQSIWNCSPRNDVVLTPKQLAALSSG